MEIIIGREEGARRLHCVAGGREFNIGAAGSVPLSVSRQHCKLTVNGNDITIENIKVQNITFVDGNQIVSKTISATSKVQLGEERFLIPLQQILQLATGGKVGAPEVPTFSLQPLEAVWQAYDRRIVNIQNKAAKFANKQRLQGILSMTGMLVGIITIIPIVVRIVIIVAALLLAIYFFWKGSRDETVQQQIHDVHDEFLRKYKCPNPKCGKPFGYVNYESIKYNKQCFACGCKYTH